MIRRAAEEGTGASHHGGAWKVAYADFVTAMMAFFLVMWLLNATTEDQRKGLADYFSPNSLMSHASSGVGKPFGGHTVFDQGALVSDRGAVQVVAGARPVSEPDAEEADQPPEPPAGGKPPPSQAVQHAPATAAQAGPAPAQPAQAAQELHAKEQAQDQTERRFSEAAAEIQRRIAADPELAGLVGQIRVDITPRGLRVQLLDSEGHAMFATGSAAPNERTRLLIRKLVPVLQTLPGPLAVEGHTDAAPYPGPERTNWDLSAERANAARRMLAEGGLPDSRVQEVTGHADHDLLTPDQPLAPGNRRIAIIVLRPPGGAEPAQ